MVCCVVDPADTLGHPSSTKSRHASGAEVAGGRPNLRDGYQDSPAFRPASSLTKPATSAARSVVEWVPGQYARTQREQHATAGKAPMEASRLPPESPTLVQPC